MALSIQKVPAGLGWTYRHGDAVDAMHCVFVVSWRLTLADIIRSLRRSKPRATGSALDLLTDAHYSV